MRNYNTLAMPKRIIAVGSATGRCNWDPPRRYHRPKRVNEPSGLPQLDCFRFAAQRVFILRRHDRGNSTNVEKEYPHLRHGNIVLLLTQLEKDRGVHWFEVDLRAGGSASTTQVDGKALAV